jgi:hypothetical protein
MLGGVGHVTITFVLKFAVVIVVIGSGILAAWILSGTEN